MPGLPERIKSHPFAAAMIIVLVGMVLGTGAGLLFALEATRSISASARAVDPDDPLDLLPLVAFGYIAVGFCAGVITGLFAAIIVYFTNKKRGSEHLNN